MPSAQQKSLDIERLLGELHRKKRWLDTVIEGLEQASRSHEFRFVEAVQAVFGDGQMPWVDLPADSQTLLRALAAQIPRRGPAMDKRSAAADATEAA